MGWWHVVKSKNKEYDDECGIYQAPGRAGLREEPASGKNQPQGRTGPREGSPEGRTGPGGMGLAPRYDGEARASRRLKQVALPARRMAPAAGSGWGVLALAAVLAPLGVKGWEEQLCALRF